MKFSIRNVDIRSPKVVALLTKLQKQILPGDTVCEPDHGQWWIVYTEKGEPAGFAGMVQSSQWTDAVFFCRSGVIKAYRGNGIQKRLIKARIRKARSMGYNWAISDTSLNPASGNSLISCGFRLMDVSRPWGWDYTNYWRLKLLDK